jgi:hypothetical protein
MSSEIDVEILLPSNLFSSFDKFTSRYSFVYALNFQSLAHIYQETPLDTYTSSKTLTYSSICIIAALLLLSPDRRPWRGPWY